MGCVMVLNYLCHAMAGAKLSYSYLQVQMSATGYISQKLKRFVRPICEVFPGWLSFIYYLFAMVSTLPPATGRWGYLFHNANGRGIAWRSFTLSYLGNHRK